jgi:chlorobactene glucosyltransferase
MVYQYFAAVLLSVFFLNLTLNLWRLRVPQQAVLNGPLPLVSVIIPARNEEKNIRACLLSLLGQNYGNFEIIVLDDNSTDATAAIVRRMTEEDDRLHLLHGEPLPQGWAGKPHACYQAALAARGKWLLFLDADTIVSPDMLTAIIPVAVSGEAALVSGFPRQQTSLVQKAAIPLMYFFVVSWAPLWLERKGRRLMYFSLGQFLLFNRKAYWDFGGHEAVKGRIIEDIWLGVEVSRRGGRQLTLDLSSLVTTKMYDKMEDMWHGLVKWSYSVAALSPILMVTLILVGTTTFFLPLCNLLRAISTGVYPVLPLILAQVAIIFLMRWLVDNRFGESVVATLLHPVGFLIWLFSAIWGLGLRLTRSGVSWKNRFYDRASQVE